MIKITSFKDIEQHFNIPKAAIAFLESANADTPNGKYPFGADCFINVMHCTTKTEQGVMEAHNIYVDVQCLLTGEEKILYTDKTDLPVTTPYDAQKDASFHSFDKADVVTYRAGEGVVLYPNEAHLPCLAVSEPMTVKKAVVKLNCEQLAKRA